MTSSLSALKTDARRPVMGKDRGSGKRGSDQRLGRLTERKTILQKVDPPIRPYVLLKLSGPRCIRRPLRRAPQVADRMCMLTVAIRRNAMWTLSGPICHGCVLPCADHPVPLAQLFCFFRSTSTAQNHRGVSRRFTFGKVVERYIRVQSDVQRCVQHSSCMISIYNIYTY